ncbi:hypothetical protein [Bradyrhizobium liaoningense]
MKDLKPVLRPIWIAALVRIRRAGRHLRFLSRWLASILRLGARMWPVSTVWLILSLCFLLPGLASSQTFEAMIQYAGGDAQAGISWARLLTTVIFTLCFAAALKSTACDLLEKYPGREKTSPLRLRIVLCICQWFPALAIAIAFFRMQSTQAVSFHPFRTMAVVLLAFQVAAAFLGKAVRRNGPILPEQFRRRRHLTAFVAIVVIVAFFGASDKDRWLGMPISSVAAAQLLGPINVLLLFLATFLFLTTALIAAGRFIRVPIVVILSCLALVLGWYDLNDNHKVRQARENSEKAPTVENAFDSWMAGRADKDQFDEYPVILVSAEGGGIRAAFFTAITLARIADRCPRMSNHIFAISGVSGGAVGAALFAAAMKAWPPDVGNSRCDLKARAPAIYEEALAKVLQDDHLSPLLARMLFPDFAQQFLPFPVESFDRQMGLEFSLERSFRRVFGQDLLSRSIYNLRPDDAHPAVPYLFLNTTEVQSGRRFVVSPLFLQSPPFGGAEDWHWLDWNFGPPVSAAAGVSARFPVFSPAGYSYNNGLKARYVDGGYIDNSGAVSLSEIFTALYLLREEKYLADENRAGPANSDSSLSGFSA